MNPLFFYYLKIGDESENIGTSRFFCELSREYNVGFSKGH